MPEPAQPSADYPAERLVFFTDAVAAIAITLLVLPLLETVGETPDFGELIREHAGQFGAFAMSFAVISRFWWAHHRIFQHLPRVTTAVVVWNALWAFGVAFLPIPTAAVTAYTATPGSVALYGATLVLISCSLTVIAFIAYRHPELTGEEGPEPADAVLGNFTILVAQVVATALGASFPGTVNYWAYLLLFLTAPVETLVKRRWRARDVAALP